MTPGFGMRRCPWCLVDFKPRRRDQTTCGESSCRQRDSRHRRANLGARLRCLVDDLLVGTYRDRAAARVAWKYRYRVVTTPLQAERVAALASTILGRLERAAWVMRHVEAPRYRPPVPNTGRRIQAGCGCRRCRNSNVVSINREAAMPATEGGRIRLVEVPTLRRSKRLDPFASKRVATIRPRPQRVRLELAA